MSASATSPVPAGGEPARPSRLGLATWLRFLVGDYHAILAVAGSRQALWLGLLFVLSTGLARAYDGAYLAAEPWHLILPVAASLATSGLLVLLIKSAARSHELPTLGWKAGYRTVLTFFWMTAPLAWIYAIPVERMYDAGTAMQMNLRFLAIVSAWRVLLITRALAVWLGESALAMFWIVAFLSVTVALIMAWTSPTPIWDIMGGVRLPPEDEVVLSMKLMLYFIGVPAWFVLAIPGCWVMFHRKTRWLLQATADGRGLQVAAPAWAFAVLLLVAGCALLPWGQPEQARAHEARRLLTAGSVDEGVQHMARFSPVDFPPHWRPPPNVGYREKRPNIVEALLAVEKHKAPDWVRTIYLEKLESSSYLVSDLVDQAAAGDATGLNMLLDYLERTVARDRLRWQLRDELRRAEGRADLDEASRSRIRGYLSDTRPQPGP